MSKTITIESCRECSELLGGIMQLDTCGKMHMVVDVAAGIPSWCPLPDSKSTSNITKCGHGTRSDMACHACQTEISALEIAAYLESQENKP